MIGDDLQSCRDALSFGSADSLHLLERTSISLQIQNSIVPSISRLARFKVSGALPHLRINFSDYKYKALMRIVDVCIPRLDDENELQPPMGNVTGGFSLAPNMFGQNVEYYTGDDDSKEVKEKDPEGSKAVRFAAQ